MNGVINEDIGSLITSVLCHGNTLSSLGLLTFMQILNASPAVRVVSLLYLRTFFICISLLWLLSRVTAFVCLNIVVFHLQQLVLSSFSFLCKKFIWPCPSDRIPICYQQYQLRFFVLMIHV